MPEVKGKLYTALWNEALIRKREGLRLSMMARYVEAQGVPEMADAIRAVARHNQVERIKLEAKIGALES